MAPKKSTKAPAVPRQIEHSQSDSQDASQDSGMSVAAMTEKFGMQMKASVRTLRSTHVPVEIADTLLD